MPRLDALAELMLQATKWVLTPGNNRDALGKAGLAVRFKRPADPWPIEALPETRTLAELAIAAASCGRAELGETKRQLDSAIPLARDEIKAWRADQAIDQAEAETRKFGAPAPVPVPVDLWKERADL